MNRAEVREHLAQQLTLIGRAAALAMITRNERHPCVVFLRGHGSLDVVALLDAKGEKLSAEDLLGAAKAHKAMVTEKLVDQVLARLPDPHKRTLLAIAAAAELPEVKS